METKNGLVKILSIDGGGIRGIIPGTILKYLEEKIQEKTGNSETRISDYFDLLAGTSTGGILTLALICPNEQGKAKYSAKKAVGFYIDRGTEIFSVSTRKKITSLGGLIDEKYSVGNLEKVFEEYFGKTKLSELTKPCLITSYDIKNRKEVFFNKTDAKNPDRDFLITDVARATSAAPTYFEPAHIHSLKGIANPMIDGGVFANNPAMCALVEVTKLEKVPSLNDIFILSLGTGEDKKNKKTFSFDEAKDWGQIGWVRPIIDIMMDANSETVDYQLNKIFESTGGTDRYYRLQPELENADPDMGNASKKNIKALVKDALEYIEVNKDKLDKIVKLIITG